MEKRNHNDKGDLSAVILILIFLFIDFSIFRKA